MTTSLITYLKTDGNLDLDKKNIKKYLGCEGLTTIVISEGVKKIEKYAFFECHALTSVVIPKSVTEICKKATPSRVCNSRLAELWWCSVESA